MLVWRNVEKWLLCLVPDSRPIKFQQKSFPWLQWAFLQVLCARVRASSLSCFDHATKCRDFKPPPQNPTTTTRHYLFPLNYLFPGTTILTTTGKGEFACAEDEPPSPKDEYSILDISVWTFGASICCGTTFHIIYVASLLYKTGANTTTCRCKIMPEK